MSVQKLFRALAAMAGFALLVASPSAHPQTVLPPVAAGDTPWAVAVNPVTNRIYVTNELSDSVTVIDGATHATTTIPVGDRPQYIAVNPLTNRIYVVNGNAGSLTVINGQTHAVIATLETGTVGPISINPVTNKIYIVRLSDSQFDETTIVDGNDNSWYDIATQSFQPRAVAVNPVTNMLYIAHYDFGHLRAIDASSTSDHPPGALVKLWDHAVAVAVNPVTNKIYAVTEDARGPIAVVDGVTNEPVFLTPAGHATGGKTIAVNPVTNKIYAAFAGEVIVVDGATNAMTFIPSGGAAGPVAIGIDSSTNKIYVPNANGTLTVVDGATNAATSIAIPAGARGAAVNPVTNRVYIVGDQVTVIDGSGAARRDMPINTTIDPLPGNASGTAPVLTLRASTSFTPTSPGLMRVFYQLDSLNGAWTAAEGSGPYTARLTGLAPGTHTLRAFAVDSQFAPSTVTHPQNTPLIGDIAAYTFTVSGGGGEVPASLAFAASSSSVAEGTAQVALQVNRTGSGANAVSVAWATVNGSAQSGSDFGAGGNSSALNGTLSWAAGDMAPKSINVPILDDSAVETGESFAVTLSAPTGGAVLGSASTATVNVADNDTSAETVRLRFAAASVTATETGANVTLQVVREGPADVPVSVSFATSNGSAVAPGDYTAAAGVISLPAGLTSKSITIGRTIVAAPYVRVIVDGVAEPAETFNIALSSPSGASLAEPSSATVTIASQLAPASLQFSTPAITVTEGVASVTLSVVRSGDATQPASVNWSTADGTALAGADFGVSGDSSQLAGTLAWNAGQAGARTVVIPILNDAAPESAKLFTVALSEATGASLGTNTTARVTINDNDNGLAFGSASYAAAESAATVTLRVDRVGSASTTARITWVAVNGTALAGRDFGTSGSATPPSGVLSWGIGDTAPKTFAIRLINDALNEGDLGFTVELRNPTGANLGSPSVANVTILEDEVPPESALGFDQPKYLVLEGGGEATISVSRSALPGGGFARTASVRYATVSGTALAGSDFAARSGTLDWGAGESGSKSFTIPIVNDVAAESPETFKVTLSSPSAGASIATPHTVVLIVDTDEVFPEDGAMPADWTVPAGAAAGWTVSNEPGAYEGAYSLRSDAIGDGEAAQLEVGGNFSAGTVSFRLRISSEADFDFLRFYVDGAKVGEWSGKTNTGWQVFNTPLTAGAHTLRWSYEKDASASLGVDAAWIDAVMLPARTP